MQLCRRRRSSRECLGSRAPNRACNARAEIRGALAAQVQHYAEPTLPVVATLQRKRQHTREAQTRTMTNLLGIGHQKENDGRDFTLMPWPDRVSCRDAVCIRRCLDMTAFASKSYDLVVRPQARALF